MPTTLEQPHKKEYYSPDNNDYNCTPIDDGESSTAGGKDSSVEKKSRELNTAEGDDAALQDNELHLCAFSIW